MPDNFWNDPVDGEAAEPEPKKTAKKKKAVEPAPEPEKAPEAPVLPAPAGGRGGGRYRLDENGNRVKVS